MKRTLCTASAQLTSAASLCLGTAVFTTHTYRHTPPLTGRLLQAAGFRLAAENVKAPIISGSVKVFETYIQDVTYAVFLVQGSSPERYVVKLALASSLPLHSAHKFAGGRKEKFERFKQRNPSGGTTFSLKEAVQFLRAKEIECEGGFRLAEERFAYTELQRLNGKTHWMSGICVSSGSRRRPGQPFLLTHNRLGRLSTHGDRSKVAGHVCV